MDDSSQQNLLGFGEPNNNPNNAALFQHVFLDSFASLGFDSKFGFNNVTNEISLYQNYANSVNEYLISLRAKKHLEYSPRIDNEIDWFQIELNLWMLLKTISESASEDENILSSKSLLRWIQQCIGIKQISDKPAIDFTYRQKTFENYQNSDTKSPYNCLPFFGPAGNREEVDTDDAENEDEFFANALHFLKTGNYKELEHQAANADMHWLSLIINFITGHSSKDISITEDFFLNLMSLNQNKNFASINEEKFFSALCGDLDSMIQNCETFDDYLWSIIYAKSVSDQLNKKMPQILNANIINAATQASGKDLSKSTSYIMNILSSLIAGQKMYLTKTKTLQALSSSNPQLSRLLIHLKIHNIVDFDDSEMNFLAESYFNYLHSLNLNYLSLFYANLATADVKNTMIKDCLKNIKEEDFKKFLSSYDTQKFDLFPILLEIIDESKFDNLQLKSNQFIILDFISADFYNHVELPIFYLLNLLNNKMYEEAYEFSNLTTQIFCQNPSYNTLTSLEFKNTQNGLDDFRIFFLLTTISNCFISANVALKSMIQRTKSAACINSGLNAIIEVFRQVQYQLNFTQTKMLINLNSASQHMIKFNDLLHDIASKSLDSFSSSFFQLISCLEEMESEDLPMIIEIFSEICLGASSNLDSILTRATFENIVVNLDESMIKG